jgi:hypothetical protein
MRLGLLEIIVILRVLVVIAVSARIFRANTGPARQGSNSSMEGTARQVNQRAPRIWSQLRRVGIALIIAGAVFLFAAIGMFRWAFQSYMWSFIMVVIGFAIVFLSRNK